MVLEIPGDGDSVININDLMDTPIWDLWSACTWSEFATMDDVAVVQPTFIAIFLLGPQRLGSSSRFAVYIDSLPGELRLLSQWTQAVRKTQNNSLTI